MKISPKIDMCYAVGHSVVGSCVDVIISFVAFQIVVQCIDLLSKAIVYPRRSCFIMLDSVLLLPSSVAVGML